MPTVMVSPCGTSVLTNDTEEPLRKLLNRTANCKEEDLTAEQKEIIDKHLVQRQQQIADADLSKARKLSAELNGIITHCNGNFSKSDHHFLLATDTYLGRNTAQFVADWLRKHKVNAIPKVVQDLSTKDVEAFRIAMSEIVRWCSEELEQQYPRPFWKVIFNLTGGFKSVNGFLQTTAMFYADESIYIFESGGQLLKIPRLPVQLDPEKAIGNHLQIFRRLAVLRQELTVEECEDIPETLLERIDNCVALSEWGELIWQKCWRNYYCQNLLLPLSSKLSYSDRFPQDAKKLSSDRLLIVNERLDQISCYLDSNGSYNPRSLDFKPLKGRPFKGKFSPEPTHECDAWSDKDARRLYGHFDGENYVIDQLGEHL